MALKAEPVARFLKQYVLPSDNHSFVGRIYDLSIVGMHFDSYEDLAKHADCKYAFDVNYTLSSLTRRVESLNMVGGMLWPTSMPENFKDFPISRYEWLTVSADVFLGRYISVVDCAIILVNEILECGLSVEACTLTNLKKKPVPQDMDFCRLGRASLSHRSTCEPNSSSAPPPNVCILRGPKGSLRRRRALTP